MHPAPAGKDEAKNIILNHTPVKHKKRKHDNPHQLKAAMALVPNRPGTPWREILATCCEILDTTPGDLRRYDSRPYVSDRRHIVAVELYLAGYVSREVGAILFRDGATIRTSKVQYSRLYRYDPAFRALAMAVDEAVQALLTSEPIQI